ncbi:MAG: hypothetical protein IPM32_14460 [Ignavibacteriae bacterium]|nr:hypothetical protein [Ignavibacteriota bacterium]
MPDIQLSEHFYLSEFHKSQTAVRLNIKNIPNQQHINNMKLLCRNVLEPIRAYYNKPIIITSGFRSKELNSRIGGSFNSKHCQGKAADFIIPGFDVEDVFYKIIYLANAGRFKYDQLILEFSEWIHISNLNDPKNNKCRNLIAVKDEKNFTVYNKVMQNNMRY